MRAKALIFLCEFFAVLQRSKPGFLFKGAHKMYFLRIPAKPGYFVYSVIRILQKIFCIKYFAFYNVLLRGGGKSLLVFVVKITAAVARHFAKLVDSPVMARHIEYGIANIRKFAGYFKTVFRTRKAG